VTGTEVVRRRVRSVFRAHALLVVVESLVVAASAGIATIAAELASSSVADPVQRTIIALLVAALASAAWILERLGDSSSVARRLDRDRGLRGAVLTAFQAEASPATSEVASLLGSRVAPEISAKRFLATASRSSAVLLALPCLAIAVWSLAADGAREAPSPEPHARTRAGAAIADRTEALRARAADLVARDDVPPAVDDEFRRIAAEAAALRTSRAAPSVDPEGSLRELERRLELALRAIPNAAVTRREAGGTMEGPGSAEEPAADGTMRDERSNARTGESPAPTPPGGDSGERGALASRWWASRYDAVVDRWVEARRRAPETSPR